MYTFLRAFCLSLVVITLSACDRRNDEMLPNTSNNRNEEVPADTSNSSNEEVLADTFFFGCAYLDANGNGQVDENDPMIADMTFSITLSGGGGFGGRTSQDNCAMVIIPGGLDESHWPVTARMQPPEDANYTWIGSAEPLLEYPESHTDFLFVER